LAQSTRDELAVEEHPHDHHVLDRGHHDHGKALVDVEREASEGGDEIEICEGHACPSTQPATQLRGIVTGSRIPLRAVLRCGRGPRLKRS
jgi:hypothetical protein